MVGGLKKPLNDVRCVAQLSIVQYDDGVFVGVLGVCKIRKGLG